MVREALKKTIRKETWVLLGLLLLLCSCAQKLPDHNAGYAKIAVPYQTFNETTYPMVRAIELKSSSDEEFSIRLDQPPFNDDVILSEPIPHGEYIIDFYLTKVVPVPGVNDRMRQQSTKFSAPVQVTLQDGDLFIFPLTFRAHQFTRADYIYCNIGYSELESARQNYYRDKLSEMENSNVWMVKTR